MQKHILGYNSTKLKSFKDKGSYDATDNYVKYIEEYNERGCFEPTYTYSLGICGTRIGGCEVIKNIIVGDNDKLDAIGAQICSAITTFDKFEPSLREMLINEGKRKIGNTGKLGATTIMISDVEACARALEGKILCKK